MDLSKFFSEEELERPYFLTGAGVSLESGIPTFRGNDAGAVWNKLDVSMGTLNFFKEDPVTSWTNYLERFDKVAKAVPSSSHMLIKDIEKEREGTVIVTQNVDGLHTVAGSKNVYEVHGSFRYVRCSKHRCHNGSPDGLIATEDVSFDKFRIHKTLETIPKCPICDSLIRPHVLWFDESYLSHNAFGFQSAINALEGVTVVMALGTSMQVAIASYIKQWSIDYLGIRMVCVDPFVSDCAIPGVKLIKAPANDFLKTVFSR